MSGLGSLQKSVSNATTKLTQSKLYRTTDPIGSAIDRQTPHYRQQQEQIQQDQHAQDLADQQAADAKAAAAGAQPMAVRDQLFGSSSGADQVTASGNEDDLAGTPLGGARRRAASRVLVG